MTLSRKPFPFTRAAIPVATALSCGCMKIKACSSSALAQNGSNLGIGQFLALDSASDRRAAHAQMLHGVFHLLRREFGKLQRH